MTTANDVFDSELEDKISDVLHLCSTNRASISFRYRASDGSPSGTGYNQILAWETPVGETEPVLVSTPTDTIFHIASVTKILVATAIAHAIEVKAKEAVVNNRWSRFNDIQARPIRDVYNMRKRSSDPEMGFIPGNPSIYEFLVHSLGLPSCNDHIFAPDGTALMDLQDFLDYIPIIPQNDQVARDTRKRWTSYSNLNFAVIALLIEACWDGHIDDFMKETLFIPLQMHSTSIGLPPNRTTASSRWTVDQHETRRQVQIPDYKATSAEAAALGAYSTTKDLDSFFSFLISASHGVEPSTMQGFSKTVDTLLRVENKCIDGVLHYTPFGLETQLNGSIIGYMSTSGLQFREEPFTTYPAVPGTIGQGYSVHYMAGSAVGCSCATALRIDTTEDFALTVLTDTSGPVAVADHILRLILQRFVGSRSSEPLRRLLPPKRDIVRKMVVQAKKHAMDNWRSKVENDQRLRGMAHPEPFDVQGTFEGIGVPHELHIVKRPGGTLHLTISGVTKLPGGATPTSGYIEILWIDDAHLWLCVPPHISVDRLDNGDWSTLSLEVTRDGSGALGLKRKRRDGTVDRYIRRT